MDGLGWSVVALPVCRVSLPVALLFHNGRSLAVQHVPRAYLCHFCFVQPAVGTQRI